MVHAMPGEAMKFVSDRLIIKITLITLFMSFSSKVYSMKVVSGRLFITQY